jgi:5-methylcytosine-specific restriction endonuclease McrA
MKTRQSAPFELRKAVLERSDYLCWYCGQQLVPLLQASAHMDKPSVDHVLPTSRGGKDSLDNLVACCFACNAAKHNMTLEEFRCAVELRRAPTHRARLLLRRALADLRLSCGLTPIDASLEQAIAWCEQQAQPHTFWGELAGKGEGE